MISKDSQEYDQGPSFSVDQGNQFGRRRTDEPQRFEIARGISFSVMQGVLDTDYTVPPDNCIESAEKYKEPTLFDELEQPKLFGEEL